MIVTLGENHEAVGQAQNLDNPDKIDERRAQMYQDCSEIPQECRIDQKTGEG